MTTPKSGSNSDPLHLIAQEWVDHGYPITPIFEEVEPCIICGVPDNACTGHEFSTLGGSEMGYDVPPPGSPQPTTRAYMPGDSVRSDRYDIDEGSQGSQPEKKPEFPPMGPGISISQDPENPNFAIVQGSESLPPGTLTGLPTTEFDAEQGAFIIVPQDGE